MPFVGGCLQQTGMSSQSAALITSSNDELQFVDTPLAEGDLVPAETTAEPDISEAPAKPVSTEKPLPPNIRPTESLAGLIRLADSGVDENVMLSYVTNSAGTFSLGPEQIIYLNDIGVPAGVVTAMLQHDHLMVDSAVNASRASLAPNVESADLSPPAASPEPAPPADYASDVAPAQPAIESSDSMFHDSLAPYGTWVDVDGYGQCWQPSVVSINPGWQPYCDRGHWVYSDCGWFWLSDYSWGWAPFHYGRWFRHTHLGWCWQPDRVWGPSWVSWRYSNDYCGWAPLPPAACFRPGLGFTYRGRSVGFSFNLPIAASCYTFVPARNFCDFHLSRYAVHREHMIKIYNSTMAVTKIIGDSHRVINQGIPVERISAATHADIRKVALREVSTPAPDGIRSERLEAGGRTLTVFRPHVVQQPRTVSAPSQRSNNEVRQPGGTGLSSGFARVPSQNSPLTVTRSPEPQLPSAVAITRPSVSNNKRETAGSESFRARSDIVGNGNASARTRVAPRNEPAPLIIHGPGRGTQAAQDSSSRYLSRSSGNQPSPGQNATTMSAMHSRTPSASSLTTSRSVQGPPRFEHPSNYQPESPVSRPEIQTGRNPAPSLAASESAQHHFAAPAYQPPREMPHYAPAPSYSSPPAQHSNHEIRDYRASESHSVTHAAAPPAPAMAPSYNHSSSDKRGR